MATDKETKALEQKAANEKAKAQAAKTMLNFPAPKESNAKQGEGSSKPNVTFSLPTNLPPTQGIME